MNAIVVVIQLAVLVTVIKIFFNFRNRRQYKLLKQFPAHPAHPIIGHVYKVFHSTKDLLASLDEFIQTYDQQVAWMGPVPVVILKKPEDIMTVLSHTHHRDLYDFEKEWVGVGLLNAKNEDAKRSRRVLGPAFCSQMLSNYTEVFNKNSLTLVEKFKPIAERGEVIDILEYLVRANMDVIVENATGDSLEDMEEMKDTFAHFMSEPFKNIIKRSSALWLHPKLVYQLYLKITGKINIIDQMYALPHRILKNKMNNKDDPSNGANSYTSRTIADQLIRAHRQESQFSEKRMTDELRLMFIAAAETTSLTSSFLLLMLAIHQDVQQKVYEEVSELLSHSDTLTFDNLLIEMKYLEQCIKETIRLYSPIMATTRRTHTECVLQNNKVIPANTLVALMFHWTHLDENLYKNPFEWDPERYSEQAIRDRPKNSFLGFGHGPRSCIGDKYTMISMKAQAAHIINNYHLSTNITTLKRSDLCIDLAIRSKIGYPIKFASRKIHAE